MKRSIFFSLLFLGLGQLVNAQRSYVLERYALGPGQDSSLISYYLQEAYIPALKKNGVGRVGAFKTLTAAGDRLEYLLLYRVYGAQQLAALRKALEGDRFFRKLAAPVRQAPADDLAYNSHQLELLQGIEGGPPLKSPARNGVSTDSIVYELRLYGHPSQGALSSKLDMLFRGGQLQLYRDMGFEILFMAEFLTGADLPAMSYLISFPSLEAREARWEAFLSSDRWKDLEQDPETLNHVDRSEFLLLQALPFSDY